MKLTFNTIFFLPCSFWSDSNEMKGKIQLRFFSFNLPTIYVDSIYYYFLHVSRQIYYIFVSNIFFIAINVIFYNYVIKFAFLLYWAIYNIHFNIFVLYFSRFFCYGVLLYKNLSDVIKYAFLFAFFCVSNIG